MMRASSEGQYSAPDRWAMKALPQMLTGCSRKSSASSRFCARVSMVCPPCGAHSRRCRERGQPRSPAGKRLREAMLGIDASQTHQFSDLSNRVLSFCRAVKILQLPRRSGRRGHRVECRRELSRKPLRRRFPAGLEPRAVRRDAMVGGGCGL